MTQAKRRLPKTAYFVTGVCERHEFRLKPTPETRAAFAFTLVESAKRHGVDVIAVCQMSSHYHAVVYDRLGYLSEFLRDFHGVMARFGSARDGVEQTKFWSAQDGDAVELGDMATVVEKVAYTLANPTKDFIVARPETWLGVMTPVETLGEGLDAVFERPKRFFDPEGWTSEMVMFGSDYPFEWYDLMSVEDFRKSVRERVNQYVAEAHAEVAAGRRRWSGLERARKLSVWHAADVELRREVGRRAESRKRVAAATKGRVLAMLASLLDFRKARLEAWHRFRRGLRDTLFPPGTWFAWRFYGARREVGEAAPLAAPS
jgi:putative transposase